MTVQASFHWLTGIEDTFVPHAEPGKRKLDEYELLNHYTRWREDIGLMQELGVDMARYGIPWYKIEPRPGHFDWSFTDLVMAAFAEAGIAPVIDLMHYGTPLWLENLFLNNHYPERVASYAAAFAHRYKDSVTWYTPLNEPYINALFCGQTRFWPPYLEGEQGFVAIWRPIVKGMVLTEQAILAVNPRAKFMQVDASTLMLPADPQDEELVKRANFINEKLFLTYDALLGKIDSQHKLVPYLQSHGMTDAELDWHQANRGTFDFMGVNFYPHLSVHELYRDHKVAGPPGISFGTQEGDIAQRSVWVRADRYKQVVRTYWERYGIPLIHTESSSLGTPEVLIDWMEDSLQAVKELRQEGVRLEGYTWWPLYDLIDWEYRNGSKPVEDYVCPMGLWKLEMGFDGEFRRVPTAAAGRFKDFIAHFDPGPVGLAPVAG
jgi:beta-glucosidase